LAFSSISWGGLNLKAWNVLHELEGTYGMRLAGWLGR
jgi:hypothetical protein